MSAATPPDLHRKAARAPAAAPRRKLPGNLRATRKPDAPAPRARRKRSSTRAFGLHPLGAGASAWLDLAAQAGLGFGPHHLGDVAAEFQASHVVRLDVVAAHDAGNARHFGGGGEGGKV